ncbi:MAG: hypothetical protein ACLU3F_18805 [Blautia wexlerae]
MFVRKDKLEAVAGITEMPTTWDEAFKDAEKVSCYPDNDFYGLGNWMRRNSDDDDENNNQTVHVE